MERLENKVVVITGAASGLGKADAIRLSSEGAKLVLTDINSQDGNRVARECKNAAIFVEQDVSDESSWQELIDTTVSEFGQLDVLVNNAGIAATANIESVATDQWREILRVNLDSVFFGCRAAIPEMSKSGGGSIINMSSTAALVGLSSYLAYSAAKGGIRSMTKSIAVHCREQKNNIRCNSIHPGSIYTPMVDNALKTLMGIELMDQEDPEATRIAMGIGEPVDVANLVLFLASDESKHINGAELVIDNGTTAGGTSR
jgi:3(or 17)beta-hydroxysteroid dehydrogenase|tara:strand:- start:633 stop:1409 length:777 start_codon:yes stop_codon:yes gene_type:complete